MQRVNESKKFILTNLLDSYQVVRSRPDFNLYPQMPSQQIRHYIKQAIRNKQNVIIQLNPNPVSKQVEEVFGEMTLSPHSSHIILTSGSSKTVHLIQPQQIRHLRLAQ